MFNALLFALVVDAHVADDAQAELRDLREFICEALPSEILPNQLIELLDRISPQKRFDTCIAKCDVDEGFEKMGQILSILILHVLGL